MSTVVEALSTLKNTNIILPSKMKEELLNGKITKNESLNCESRENTDIAKDLSKEISKNVDVGIHEVKLIDDNNACFKSNNLDLSVDSKCVSNKQLEKHDKVDDKLCNEKQEVPRSIEISSIAQGTKKPQVQILSLSVISPGREDVVLPIPFASTTSKATLFTLKEGSKYRIKFHLTVLGNTIHNLKYTYMVWKSGLRVHQTKKIVGTFEPQQEPYVYELEEGTTPTGFFARGPFFVKSKFVDDEENCYLDTNYYFDIRKDWGARDK